MEVSGGSWWNRQLRRSRVIYLMGRAATRFTKKGEWGTSRFAMELDVLQGKDLPDIQRGWSSVEESLRSLRALAGSRYPVGVIALPCKELVTKTYPAENYESHVHAITDSLGFFFIDPLPALDKSGEKPEHLFIPYDRNHLSPTGHRIVAESIAGEIVDRAIVREPGGGALSPSLSMVGR
jgi:hypothetical protein